MRGGTNRLLNFPVTGLTRRVASKFRAAESMEITIGCLTLLHENFARVACLATSAPEDKILQF